MRVTLVFLLPVLVLSITARSQITCEREIDGPGREVSGPPAPIFELQKPFEHAVALPNHVLTLLRRDEESAAKFEACLIAQKPRRNTWEVVCRHRDQDSH